MDVQDVDYEVIYSTEKIIRWVTKGESVVVIERIQQETLADPILQKLGNRISLWDWTKHEKDIDIEQYWKIRNCRSSMV